MTFTDDWQALDAAHVWHPYTQHGIAPRPVPIVAARGAYLVDSVTSTDERTCGSVWRKCGGASPPFRLRSNQSITRVR